MEVDWVEKHFCQKNPAAIIPACQWHKMRNSNHSHILLFQDTTRFKELLQTYT